jgi:Fe2+ transport system protein FeoA
MINSNGPTSLDGLDLGAHGTIVRIGCPGPLRRRLMDMGLTPGTEVRLEGVAPLGDPIIVSARGCRLGLRRAEAAGITISPCSDSVCAGRCPGPHRHGRLGLAPRSRRRLFRDEVR